MCRFFILFVLFIPFSVTVLGQRDTGRQPSDGREPREGGGDRDRTAIAQPAPPRDYIDGTKTGGREHPGGHPERPAPRPDPPQTEREPVYEPPSYIYVPLPEPPPEDYYPSYPGEIIIYDPYDEDYYEPYPEIYPVVTLKMEAINLFNSKNYLRALIVLCDAITKAPADTELYFYRGLTNVKLENYAWAIEDLDIYIEKYQINKVAWYYRGLAKYYGGNRREAYKDLEFAAILGEPRAKIFLTRFY
ncbi:MAG: tetratricopeptide repeat protein [Ignavibacteriaceae bacterium]